jgi:CBS domain-containing membrane protein
MILEIPSTVANVMTRDVVTLDENDTILHLLDTLKALRFRHLPVTDGDRLIGLVSETDLLGIASSNLLPHHREQDRQLQQRFHVSDIMVRKLVTVRPGTSLKEAGRMLLTDRFGCLPVVEADNVLVGILTMSDFVKALVHAGPRRGGGPARYAGEAP